MRFKNRKISIPAIETRQKKSEIDRRKRAIEVHFIEAVIHAEWLLETALRCFILGRPRICEFMSSFVGFDLFFEKFQ